MDTLPGGGATREYAGGKMLAAKDSELREAYGFETEGSKAAAAA